MAQPPGRRVARHRPARRVPRRRGPGPDDRGPSRLPPGEGPLADDWSTRPLPESWLKYAALDVELLVDLRDAVHEELEAQGKLDWALQEFEAVRTAPSPEPRAEPWRRTSGVHRVRKARNLAVVRALWERRDELARRRDMAPGRVLPDAAIVEAAARLPKTVHELRAVPGFTGRTRSADAVSYFAALEAAMALPDKDLPHHPRAPTPHPPPSPGTAPTPPPPQDSPQPDQPSPPSPTSTTSPPRTSYSPTWSAASAGPRPPTWTTTPSPTTSAPPAPAPGRSP